MVRIIRARLLARIYWVAFALRQSRVVSPNATELGGGLPWRYYSRRFG
jgi:hypothetical protein